MYSKKMQLIFSLLCFFVLGLNVLFAQTQNDSLSDYASQFVLQGIKAYEENDWDLAVHFFQRAKTFPSASTQEICYMLIMAEMYAGKYQNLIQDTIEFKNRFPNSYLLANLEYQLGRSYYYLKQWDSAISVFSDFCVKYPNHELYSSSLFWIAETLYAMHYYSLAAAFYERIVEEYPKSVKMTEVLYRLDVIHQREKEEKLLLLLQATSEEYLSSKEDYERQLRQFQTEEAIGLRKQLNDAQAKIYQMEIDKNEADIHTSLQAEEIAQLQSILDDMQSQDVMRKTQEKDEARDFLRLQIQMLKEKAAQVKNELDEKPLEEKQK